MVNKKDQQIIWVAGGRDFGDKLRIRKGLRRADEDAILVTGSARGTDLLAEAEWRYLQRPYMGLPAQWDTFNRSAGHLRNLNIARGDVFPVPDVLIHFPGGKGTAGAVALAEQFDIEVVRG